jgi:hypothetical protein
MRKSLEFAKDISFVNLIAESYASNVVLSLNNHQQFPHYVGSIIEDCLNFKVSFHSLNLVHVRHEANQVADYFVKYILYNSSYM